MLFFHVILHCAVQTMESTEDVCLGGRQAEEGGSCRIHGGGVKELSFAREIRFVLYSRRQDEHKQAKITAIDFDSM